jgi:hypothetical protein
VVVTSSAQAAVSVAAITSALPSALAALVASQTSSQFQSMYESLSPLQSHDDRGAASGNKTGGKDATVEKPLRKVGIDAAMAGTLLAVHVLPETAPPLATQLGRVSASSNTPGSMSREESAAQTSPANHPDASSTIAAALPESGVDPTVSTNSPYLSTYAQSRQEVSSVMREVEDPTSHTSQWSVAWSTGPRLNESSSRVAIPSPMPALAPNTTGLSHGGRLQDSVSSRQVDVPSYNRFPDSPIANTGVLIIPASTVINTPSVPPSFSLVKNAKRPEVTTNRAFALRVSDSQLFLPSSGEAAANPKTESVPLAIASAVQPETPAEASAAEQGKHSEPSSGGRAPSGDIGNALLAQSLSKVPFAARSENLAFALHLQESKSAPARPQVAPPALPVRNQAVNLRSELRPAPSAGPATLVKEMTGTDVSRRVSSSGLQAVWSEASAVTHTDPGPSASTPTPAESHVHSTAAMQDLQPVPPETPKVAASSEIQLHLKANDQISASIRVTDRAGAVNISVHASDPQVRNSLRSNLSDLSAQLNTQGWKTEVVKTASVITRTDNGQDTPPDGKHSFSQQQHSANAERQPHRDRHPNSGHWQDEFEEQITGNDANRGGKN